MDLDNLCAALSATRIQFDDIIDVVHPFEWADEAIEKVWQGKVVGKVVLQLSSIALSEYITRLEVVEARNIGRSTNNAD
jgi:hypothetical protein